MSTVKKEVFIQEFQSSLGDYFQRAMAIFDKYGELLSYDVTNVLLQARDQNQVDEVLTELEKHWDEHLSQMHPEARKMYATKETEMMFLVICQDILKLQPNPI